MKIPAVKTHIDRGQSDVSRSLSGADPKPTEETVDLHVYALRPEKANPKGKGEKRKKMEGDEHSYQYLTRNGERKMVK